MGSEDHRDDGAGQLRGQWQGLHGASWQIGFCLSGTETDPGHSICLE